MSPRVSLWLTLLALATLGALTEAGATETSLESGSDSGTVCELEMLYYFNLTVTNDDAANSDYDVHASAEDFDIAPASANFTLAYDESETVRFEVRVPQGTAARRVQVDFDVTSTNGDDVSVADELDIARCARLELHADTAQVTGNADERLELPFTLTNHGNGRDYIALTLEGLPEGWEAEFTRNLSLKAGQSVKLTVFVTPDGGETVTLRLVATTLTPGLNRATASITLEAQGPLAAHRNALLGGATVLALAAGAVWYLRRVRCGTSGGNEKRP